MHFAKCKEGSADKYLRTLNNQCPNKAQEPVKRYLQGILEKLNFTELCLEYGRLVEGEPFRGREKWRTGEKYPRALIN